ncbi:hypothetical protein MMC34_007127 [Xylographa carneopallida]|nr:hypothetical protein [Xylographa carneopallida]
MASTLSGDVDQSLTKAERDIKRHLCQGPNEDNIIAIESEGDLLIKIDGQPGEPSFYYRVSSIVLQKASPYFDRLLDPKKFSEGVAFGAQIEKLKESYPDITTVPAAALPMIQVSDVGQIPARYPSKNVVTHFFDILHDTNSFWIMTGSLPNHIALLAILADRFDATKPVLDYINDQGWTHAHKETKENKKESSLSSVRSKEILWRQRMFAGVILGVQDWVMSYSRLLIDAGSERWKVASDTELKIDDEAPWWYLPRGLEEELAYRREAILTTISSLQSYYLQKYVSGRRQCRLGYDSSPQCDSFQLGEMIRFFSRKGTLDLQSQIVEHDYSLAYPGSIDQLLISLKECPAYQIDSNHKHCGLRTKLIPALESMQWTYQQAGQIGVCLSCWRRDRLRVSWHESPAGGKWQHVSAHVIRKSNAPCGFDHRATMLMCMADSREWDLER